MFFGDAPTAFANIARALRAGAALTLLVWQKPEANDWFLELTHIVAAGRDLPPPRRHEAGPFSLADPDHTRSLLEANGFARVGAEGLHEPMWFGSTPDEALRFSTRLGILAARLRELEPLAREDALGRLRESISAHQTAEGVRYPSAMWLITASRR
jgi:hypothetical protein